MNIVLPLPSRSERRVFLGVERSACGRTWRDRLDERGAARALAIAQQHGLPDLLARVLAGRHVAVDEVAMFLDPTLRSLMPVPHTLSDMQVAVERLAEAVLRRETIG